MSSNHTELHHCSVTGRLQGLRAAAEKSLILPPLPFYRDQERSNVQNHQQVGGQAPGLCPTPRGGGGWCLQVPGLPRVTPSGAPGFLGWSQAQRTGPWLTRDDAGLVSDCGVSGQVAGAGGPTSHLPRPGRALQVPCCYQILTQGGALVKSGTMAPPGGLLPPASYLALPLSHSKDSPGSRGMRRCSAD